MQNSSTGAPHRPKPAQTPRQSLSFRSTADHGFTLLEILLVVVIIAVTTAVAIPNLFSGPREQLKIEARQLVVALNAARDEAALGGRVIGVAVNGQRVEFFERDLADANRWEPSARDSLRARSVPTEMSLNAETSSQGARIAFLPAGVSAPFAITLTSPAGSERIVADALGNLLLEAKP